MEQTLRQLNSAIGQINSAYHEASLKMGLTDSVRDILYVLCDRGSGCPQSALYKETGMTRSTVNTAIRALERDGILYLAPGRGRSTRVMLTERGECFLSETVGRLVALEEAFFRAWPPEERETLIRLNRRYAEELTRSVREWGREDA